MSDKDTEKHSHKHHDKAEPGSTGSTGSGSDDPIPPKPPHSNEGAVSQGDGDSSTAKDGE